MRLKSYQLIYLKIFILILILAWYGFFLVHKIDLTTADLGRHLKNGQVILEKNFDVLKTNFYSYTNPDWVVINHHWLSGVLFFLIWQISGFSGLSIFYLILSLVVFLIFFHLAQKQVGFKIPALLSFLIIPLIAQRTEIRPEIFTYLFCAIFFWFLWQFKNNKLSFKWLLILPLLEIFWVNAHIYFFLGPLLIGIFLLEELVFFFKTKKKRVKKLAVILGLTSAATFLNPFGLKGVVYPFSILKNYGYLIVENQSIWFLERLNIFMPNLALFKIIFILLVISFVLLLVFRRRKFSFVLFSFATLFSIISWIAIRNFTLFGFFALPIIAINLRNSFQKVKFNLSVMRILSAIFALVIFVTIVSTHYQYLFSQGKRFGFGLLPGNNWAAEFFKQEKIQGPILNNYDIGGYLIYHLCPQERVFVDNRPESYPASFFQDVYIPLQENNDIWRKQDKIYNFNVIFFSHRDYTPWGQHFLIERLDDPQWAPVFVDDYAIIFLKRNDSNQPIIEKYEIPKERFRVIKS